MDTKIVLRDVLVYILPSIYLYILGTYILVRSYPYKRARLLAISIFFSAIGYTFDYISMLLPTESGRFLQLYVVLVAFILSFGLIIYIIYDIVHSMKRTKVLLSLLVLLVATVVLWQLDLLHFNSLMPKSAGILLTALTCTLISYFLIKENLVPSAVKRYSALMETSATPIVILDKNKQVLEVNGSGKVEYQIKVNTDFRNYFNYKNEPAVLDNMFAQLDEQTSIKGYRIDYLNKNGAENIVLIDASQVKLADEIYYYCMIHEVTLEFQRRHLNEHLAYHDVLTGIYNRTYFEEEVKRKLAQERQKDSAFMICDLNFFKEINDTYGHQTGDNVLIFTANCWHENLPKPHILARLGGDEFVMFFENIQSKDQFLKQINEARHAFRLNLYKQNDIEIEIVPSIGIAFVEEDGNDYEHLYHICDVRMYEDKKIIKEHYLKKSK